MSDPAERPAERRFATVALFLVCVLYLPFFFLPVFHLEGQTLGWEGVLAVSHLPLPPFWPVMLSHLVLWGGIGLLATQRWRAVAFAGVVALLLGLISLALLGNFFPGVWAKLASTVALTAVGFIGARRFPRPAREQREWRRYLRPMLVASVGAVLVAGLLRWTVPRPVAPCNLASYTDESRHALLIQDERAGPGVEQIVYLDQGWLPRDSMDFYTRSQGSRLVPYSWFLALEQPSGEGLFHEPAHLSRFGYLTQKPNPCNPDGLPVGFVKDVGRQGQPSDWLGLTCAACHTSEIHYDGAAFRIDGGPALADLDGFLTQLTLALKQTLDDPERFDRFATRVLVKDSPAAREKLSSRLEAMHRVRHQYNVLNRTPHRDGYARLDAFGRILNQVLVTFLGVHDESQRCALDAPVSYPHLWDTPHHDFVQWNGVARNKGMGNNAIAALTRNVGQVLGVFGEVELGKSRVTGPLAGYSSSAHIPNLIHLERLLHKLQSPRWPSQFPPIDEEKRQAGERLFQRYCARCHADIDRADPNRSIRAVKTPIEVVGTDPRMATNFASRTARTGPFEGRKSLVVAGKRFGKEAPADDILIHAVLGVILNTQVKEYRVARLAELRQEKGDAGGTKSLLVYKARPLNGIWATAPYLHNGSVPNLYQLLLPAEQRLKEFHVGTRRFDARQVGFETAPFAGGFHFRTVDAAGQPIPGNSNAGHEYGTGKSERQGGDGLPALSEKERWELVEYLKSL